MLNIVFIKSPILILQCSIIVVSRVLLLDTENL